MTEVEDRNVRRTEFWQQMWNDDAMRMVDECYAENCEVVDMIRGLTFHGREQLRAVEKQMLAMDSTRRMKVTKMVASGDTVVAEMDSVWRDGTITIQSCVVLTYNADGFIVSDHTYSGDPIGVNS